MAWLSDDTGSPATRFTQATVPYVRTDGVRVADDYADLTDGTIQHAINVSESKGVASSPSAWSTTGSTGTFLDFGANPARHCSRWTDGSATLAGHDGITSGVNNT